MLYCDNVLTSCCIRWSWPPRAPPPGSSAPSPSPSCCQPSSASPPHCWNRTGSHGARRPALAVLYCTVQVLYCTVLWILSTSHCTLLYFLSPCPLLRPLVCWPDILRLQTELCFTRLWRRWLVTAWWQAPGCPYIYIALVQFSQFTFVFDFETMIDDIWLSKIFGLPKALDPRRLKLWKWLSTTVMFSAP